MGEQPDYLAPAGWFVDPGNDAQLRWWSGQDWTEHCAPLAPAAAVAGADPEHPLTRRELRLLEEQATATRALPPPASRIAPIASYAWQHEAVVRADLPLRDRPVAEVDPADLYRDIPNRWGSASVWVLAFMPWIAVISVFAALMLVTMGSRAWWWQLGALALPGLLTLAAAQRDVKRLRIWRHTTVAHWAWSLLGAPAYLVARTVVLRRNTGLGSAPLWVGSVNLLLVVALIMTLAGLAAASWGNA